MQKSTHPHDAFFKKVMNFPGVARQLLSIAKGFDINILTDEDFVANTNSFISKELEEFWGDVVFDASVRGHSDMTCHVSFLFEHKSAKPRFLRQQINMYLAQKAYKEASSGKPVRLTIPVVFYHGNQKFEITTPASDYPDAPLDLHRFILSNQILIINTQHPTDEQIISMQNLPLMNMLLIMKHFKDQRYSTERIDQIFMVPPVFHSTEEGRAFIGDLLAYYFRITEFNPQNIIKLPTFSK